MKRWCLVPLALVALPVAALPFGSPSGESNGGFEFEPAKRASISGSTGAVEAVAQVDVGSAVPRLVDKVFFSFNDTVAAGQPLIQLDRAAYEARAASLAYVSEGR